MQVYYLILSPFQLFFVSQLFSCFVLSTLLLVIIVILGNTRVRRDAAEGCKRDTEHEKEDVSEGEIPVGPRRTKKGEKEVTNQT